ncbi:hypothetical protein BayCH28_25980 [Mycolicibacterium sp. CH28]|uniref:hypothetical protein n=1 Tax=Mycolicibacterium sp. CH28 TaxID=2512237 RepID=UPI00108019B8|nr:hypothetical protein [Mycolicibacterium sp. CH28]TGD84356.1 hypothetical protein BayCH28_25980 [Mycolicibacterium sp. CH28]
MTTVVAWEREVGSQSELVMASDSRFGGGEEWDACAKIFDIGRSDALLGFAGNTWRALPLIFQILATTRSYEGSQLRTLDLPKYAGHVERVLNVVLEKAAGPASSDPPDCEFLLAGWSWSEGRFLIYHYTFDKSKAKFIVYRRKHPPRSIRARGRVRIFAAIGSGGRNFTGRIAKSYNVGDISGPIDYYPLEALYQQTIDLEIHSVGGPVQVAKVYRSIRVEHFATHTEGSLFISGRPILPYGENVNLRTIGRDGNGVWGIET